MTSGESTSLLLQRAAELIEQAESRAVIGPWSTCGPNVTGGGDEQWDVATATTSTTALWIATMSPTVAAPLANILRYEARTNGSAHRGDLIALARLILGVSAEGKERSDQ